MNISEYRFLNFRKEVDDLIVKQKLAVTHSIKACHEFL